MVEWWWSVGYVHSLGYEFIIGREPKDGVVGWMYAYPGAEGRFSGDDGTDMNLDLATCVIWHGIYMAILRWEMLGILPSHSSTMECSTLLTYSINMKLHKHVVSIQHSAYTNVHTYY